MPNNVIKYKTVLDTKETEKGLQRIRTETVKLRTSFGTMTDKMTYVNGKLTRFTTTTEQFNAKTSGLNKNMGGLITRFIGVAAAIGITMRVMRSLTDYTRKSVESYREFDTAMKEVSTILEDVNTFLPQMTAGIEGMSKAFGKSATDLASGMYDILSAAVAPEKALQLLYTASKAAVAGITEVSTSVDVMTSVMNSYGYSVEQMVHISDVMFQSVIRGKFHFEDLASALGYLTPIAAQIGIKFEELAAALATTTRFGQHIDMVARGLALSLQNIIKPSVQATKVAEQYGIDLSLAAVRAKGLVGYLEDLNEKTGGNAAIISQLIPNMRSYRVMMVLAGDGMEEVAGDATLMSESLGAADRAFNKIASSAQTTSDIVTQFGEDMKRAVGSSFFQLDLLGKKMEIFKGAFLQNLTRPMGFIPALISAGKETWDISGMIDKQIEDYQAKWKEQFGKSNFGEELVKGTDTLFERLSSGEHIDFSQLKDDQKEYETLLNKFIDMSATYAKLQKSNLPASEVTKFGEKLEDLATKVLEAGETYAYWEAGLKDAADAIEYNSDSIDIYLQRLSELKEEIGDINNLYDGTLGHELKVAEQSKIVAEQSHWITLAREDETYITKLAAQGYEWYTKEVEDALKVVADYEQQTKAATAAQQEFNFELARNRIETMKIQLLGMLRRRGNTREELRLLKKLSIERTELQIEAAEKELAAEEEKNEGITSSREQSYQEAKELLNKIMRDEEHNLWMIKDTRQEDINDLKQTIQGKENLYVEYEEAIKEAYSNMGDAIDIYKNIVLNATSEEKEALLELIKTYEQLYDAQAGKIRKTIGTTGNLKADIKNVVTNPVYSVKDVKQNARDMLDILTRVRHGEYARGTDYVPSDGLYKLHRGEAVVPKNQVGTDNNIVVNISVTGNNITKESETSIASEIGAAVQKALIDAKTGKTKYRMR